jgi:hypothetical protein
MQWFECLGALAGNDLRPRCSDAIASRNYFVQQLGERSMQIIQNFLRANSLSSLFC